MIQPTHAIRHFRTTEAGNIDEILDSAIEKLIPDALALNHGSRVDRIALGEYTVDTAVDIACGYTVYEHRVDNLSLFGVSRGVTIVSFEDW